MSAFDKIAGVYDDMYRDRRSIAENAVLRPYVEALRGLRLLDVGCGTGLVLEMLGMEWGQFYTGMDLSPTMLNTAREKHPHGTFIEQDMLQPYEADAEVITSFFALNYVGGVEQAYTAVANMRAVLVEDGYVMAVIAGQRRFNEVHIPPPLDAYFTVEDCFNMFGAFKDVQVRGMSIMTPHLPNVLPQGVFNAVARWEHSVLSHRFPESGYFMIVTGRG
jgi:ubiquinone/menaquinone biosynthesis C-methylase UbiE